MVKLIRVCVLSVAILSIVGCHSTLQQQGNLSGTEQEYILSKTNNYQGLITLYRDRLSQKEDAETRYKLAEYYYQLNDYESSLHYLKPLITARPSERDYLLQSKNLMDLGRYDEARISVSNVLQKNPKNGEAYNILGVVQAQSGEFIAAQASFNHARTLFVAEDVVINNMAMLAILQAEYQKAFDYLIPLYMRGYDSPGIVHNLVYVLVKLKDYEGADSIIRNKNLSADPERLIAELASTNPMVKKRESFVVDEASEPSQLAVVPEKKSLVAPSAAAAHNADSIQPVGRPSESVQPMPKAAPLLAKSPLLPAAQSATPAQVLAPVSQKAPPVVTNAALFAKQDSEKKKLQAKLPSPVIVTPESVAQIVPVMANGQPELLTGVRFGTHQRFSRLTLESNKPIQFRQLVSADNTKYLVEIYNINADDKLENLKKQIGLSQRDIKQISFNQTTSDTLQMEIELRRPMKVKMFNLPSEGKYKERLVLDVI